MRYVIAAMRERCDEQLSLDELAELAIMSKFHFLRVFRRLTGVTPGRFLAAVRVEKSKRLLATTSLSVLEISVRVGYRSIGSFTNRFTGSVGIPPVQYRGLSKGQRVKLVGFTAPGAAKCPQSGSVSGTVRMPGRPCSGVYLGLLSDRIFQGRPSGGVVVPGPGRFRLAGVSQASWYLHAVALMADAPRTQGCVLTPGSLPLLGVALCPLGLRRGEQVDVDLDLRPLGWSAPPVLSAVPELLIRANTGEQVLT